MKKSNKVFCAILLCQVMSAVIFCGCNTSNNTIATTTNVSSSNEQMTEFKASSTQPVESVSVNIEKIIGSANTRAKVEFGHYWQEDTNGDGKCDQKDDKLPILWQIIDIDKDGNAFLLSDKILDRQPYHNEYVEITWDNSWLRKWLNDFFINEAFSSDEQNAIQEAKLSNPDIKYVENYRDEKNQFVPKEIIIPSGEDTIDKVFLLSLADVSNSRYKWNNKPDDTSNEASPLYEAKATGYAKNGVQMEEYKEYMLRSPGAFSQITAVVESYRLLNGGWRGTNLTDANGKSIISVTTERGVRPALKINIANAGIIGEIKYEQPVGDDYYKYVKRNR